MHQIKSFDVGTPLNDENDNLSYVTWTFTPQPLDALPAGMASSNSFLDLTQIVRVRSQGQLSGNESDGGASDSESSGKIPPHVVRTGVFASVNRFDDLKKVFLSLVAKFPQKNSGIVPRLQSGPIHALHIAFLEVVDSDAESTSSKMTAFLRQPENAAALKDAMIRRVTFLLRHTKKDQEADKLIFTPPAIYTFRSKEDFAEDNLFRHIEPSHAYHLDLVRLTNFKIKLADTIQTDNGNVHLYEALPKPSTDSKRKPGAKRFFARVVSMATDHIPSEIERMLVDSLNSLYLAIGADEQAAISSGKKPAPLTNNHIFFNVLAASTVVDPDLISYLLRNLSERYGDKLTRLGVHYIEVKLVCRLSEDTSPVALRFNVTNPTGFVLRVETYIEAKEGSKIIFQTIAGAKNGPLHGLDVTSPYPPSLPFEEKRQSALLSSDTLYCFDFLELLERAVEVQWEDYAKARLKTVNGASGVTAGFMRPATVLDSVELVVFPKGQASDKEVKWTADDYDSLEIRELRRPHGQNVIGMVAWKVTMFTPEYPDGRQIIIIANDITISAGSFGTKEDALFALASRYSREQGLPRIYLAANSGARIGMADSVKKKFKVAWVKEEEPEVGFKYLYLTKEDYQELKAANAVNCDLVMEGSEERYVIKDIIGLGGEKEADLGVENLKGSGTIAGETSVAYNDVFTMTVVVGRTVGIGAYLVRLGQRTIQKYSNSPIILTGYQALNKLMGKDIYTSNDQLGGPMIMYPNGVSHLLVDNHLEALISMLKWLSFVPRVRHSMLPMLDITGVDVVERNIDFTPQKGIAYDPRQLVAGTVNEIDGTWVSGFFDKGSFMETLGGWAKTVVCGRGRLGGIPVGVIMTESRTAEAITPADPADSSSQERNIQQAGGVWFPDSAYKTAQAIKDFEGEDLPLIIFANWRGFSGGQRDMFDEVLKFGAMIVDALVAFKQPIFVYIPPFAELRGGAWVVVDATINAECMEMYAASDARGGVLEPNGAASIKFRAPEYIAAAHRLDPILKQLDAQAADPNLSAEDKQELAQKIKVRERILSNVYSQIAVQFADSHDTPGRMVAVGVIREVVPWAKARSYFYWRLRRRLAEFSIRTSVAKAANVSKTQASKVLKEWFVESGKKEGAWEDDREVLAWMGDQATIHQKMSALQSQHVSSIMGKLVQENPDAAIDGIIGALSSLSPSAREAVLAKVRGSA